MYLQRSAAASIFQDPFYAEIFERNVKIGTGSSNSGQVCVSHGGTSDLGDVVEITKKMWKLFKKLTAWSVWNFYHHSLLLVCSWLPEILDFTMRYSTFIYSLCLGFLSSATASTSATLDALVENGQANLMEILKSRVGDSTQNCTSENVLVRREWWVVCKSRSLRNCPGLLICSGPLSQPRRRRSIFRQCNA